MLHKYTRLLSSSGRPTLLALFLFLVCSPSSFAQVLFDESSPYLVRSIAGQATWTRDLASEHIIYDNNGTAFTRRALLYSPDAYQSDDGFRLTVEYNTGSVGDSAAHNFSFGLISDETNLSGFSGFNPFKVESSVYSIGANLTADNDPAARGLNFTDGSQRVTLDTSGSRVEFATNDTTKVVIEIGIGGFWSYFVNDVYEASGVLVDGFDLGKNYHVAVYGQDDNGGGKAIKSIKLEQRYAPGERANHVRGTWVSGVDVRLMDAISDLRTLDSLGVGFNSGASQSALHFAPHKILETIALVGADGNDSAIDLVTPTWGDLSLDEPEVDEIRDQILQVRAAGLQFQAYSNSENFVGNNGGTYDEFAARWRDWCDINPQAQEYLNSQPFHTGVWNRTTEQYDDATDSYPDRKYMFCYAEFVLKDYALRYGKYVDRWIFDDGGTMEQQGDNATSGLIEEQRIYQAFSNAVHAGNPEIPTAYNNGRSNVNYNSYPFAHALRFEDFTFGHAFGGNNNHAEQVNGNQFNLNYRHVTRMTETDGDVHAGGSWTWDDQIVGNFHSKLSTTSWKFGPNQAWQQDDFNQWNLEAMLAGGSMTWDGSYNRPVTSVYAWVPVLLGGMDDYLAQFQSPGAPNWARAYTVLPDASLGQGYSHTLNEDVDFWDPEGNDIVSVTLGPDAPFWLGISELPESSGNWVLSGTPQSVAANPLVFELQATDSTGLTGTRQVTMTTDEVLPIVPTPSLPGDNDTDGDGVSDAVDNCMLISNVAQRDSNGDGFGNACDADLNNDCTVNTVDLGLLRLAFFGTDADADFNGDGSINVVDLGIIRGQFFAPPGPSGLTNACDGV